MKQNILLTLAIMLTSFVLQAQNTDKGHFVEYKPGFYQNTILKDVKASDALLETPKQYPRLFIADIENKDFPTEIEDYTIVWHSLPKSQGNAGTCWCYAATSLMESEIYRIHSIKTDLSEMYTTYWEYVERAEDFVNTRGETYFNEGSESNAIPKIWKEYGIVPESAYSGLLNNRKYHSHREMVSEMKAFLEGVKSANNWDTEQVRSTIISILNKYMGAPPEEFIVSGKTYTPLSYLSDYIKISPNNYFSFMSTMMWPYNESHELVEADNWWHADNYYNLQVEEYTQLLKDAIIGGYSVCICGDVSEPGHNRWKEVAIVPDFDIASDKINSYSREMRLQNGATTDDHCIHVVGYTESNGETWFLIKDSGSGAFDGPHKGYRFFHEDYISLKMMNFLMHHEPADNILNEIIK